MLDATIQVDGKPMQVSIPDEQRQECEIWSRVMGYYRPVNEYNIGKKSEHYDRVFFDEGKTIAGLEKMIV